MKRVPEPRQSYPFEACEPGQWWQLDRDEDYTGSSAQVQMAAYKYAQRRGWNVQSQRNDRQGWFRLCFTAPEPTPTAEPTPLAHRHSPTWSRTRLAEHIAQQHPEHIYPNLTAMRHWTLAELTASHDEMHQHSLSPAEVDDDAPAASARSNPSPNNRG